MYIEQILKNNVFLIFCQFYQPNLEPCHILRPAACMWHNTTPNDSRGLKTHKH